MRGETYLAKISRPKVSNILERKRLFKKLDQGLKKPVVWISSPAGSGKTTLVSSYIDAKKLPCVWYQVDEGDADIASFFYYMGLAGKKAAPRKRKPLPLLTPEYILGIPTFTKRFFEQLYDRLPSKCVLVFDNYQTAPDSCMFHDMIMNGLSVLPEKVHVIVVSREGIPPSMARIKASGHITMVGWEDIRLTLEDTKGIIRNRKGMKLAREHIEAVHAKTDGWVAGLELMLESIKSGYSHELTAKGHDTEDIFNYFAGEIFDQTERTTQEFLLKTAVLPQMTLRIAEELTGVKNAGKILSNLNRKNFFTVKRYRPEVTYSYHSLFRDFLMDRAGQFLSPEERAGLEQRAAHLLEESGNFEEAADLYINSVDHNGLIGLIMNNAPMLLMQGRNKILEQWIVGLPEEMIESSPWLLYWLGSSIMPLNPPESQPNFERALALFANEKNPIGVFLSWSGLVMAIYYSLHNMQALDELFRKFDILIEKYSEIPPEAELQVVTAMVQAFTMRNTGHPDAGHWMERGIKLFREKKDVNSEVNAIYPMHMQYIARGEAEKSVWVRNRLNVLKKDPGLSPLSRLLIKFYESVDMADGDFLYKRNIKSVFEGVDLADSSGVHVMDPLLLGHGATALLNIGDLSQAEEVITLMSQRLEFAASTDVSMYHYILAWRDTLQKNFPAAYENATIAHQLAMDAGIPWAESVSCLMLSVAAYNMGKNDEAQQMMSKASDMSIKFKFFLNYFSCLLYDSLYTFDLGNDDDGYALLSRAMGLGKRLNAIKTLYHWNPDVMLYLCIKALEAGIEVEYVQELIKKRNLVPEEPPVHIDNWPWAVKIDTLGRFGIERHGELIQFKGKVQKKPLEMLKAIIAFGGRDVREERISDALWPDADGDVAHKSFATNLHRLRKLIGIEEALQMSDGRVSIDRRYCRVDVWAFERFIKLNEDNGNIEMLRKGIDLYRGDFLAGDDSYDWAVSLREFIKQRVLHGIEQVGEAREKEQRYTEAVSCYRRGLEIDSLMEHFYQRLMICYRKLGRKAEAIKIYDQCRDTLSSMLHIGPSEITEEIYKEIRG